MSTFTWTVIALVGMIGVFILGWHLGYRAQIQARRTVGEHFHSLGFGVSFPCTDERCPERRDEP